MIASMPEASAGRRHFVGRAGQRGPIVTRAKRLDRQCRNQQGDQHGLIAANRI